MTAVFPFRSARTLYWLASLFESTGATAAGAPAEDEDSDAADLARVAGGDESALQHLFDKWKLPLQSFFYRSLGSNADAEDLTLEVFVRLHRSAAGYRPVAKFSTYIFHIAHNLLRNELRRRRPKPVEPMAADAFDYVEAETDGAARRLIELEEVFQHALERLPEKYRTPLLLLQQQRMNYPEVAATLRMTENALRVLVHRGRQLLKIEMETLS